VKRVLFVSNGHGEAAIADRIAEELREYAPGVEADHLALVGEARSSYMRDVGPQRQMPSGGIIAMANVRNIARDLRGGLIGLTLAQRRFLQRARGEYAHTIAVGDVYALLMTYAAHAPMTFVGTAKSVRVAPYGPMEERVLRRAEAIFVRDEPTAERLRSHGVPAQAPGNVIVDLFATHDDPEAARVVAGFEPVLAIFPGSRESAYEDAVFLVAVARACSTNHPALGAALSIAPMLDAERFAAAFAADGWTVERHANDERIPFSLRNGDRTIVRAWRGAIGPLITRATAIIGQAGTANEAAAAAGVPVVAFELSNDRKTRWYRMRQHGLLDGALEVLPGEPGAASAGVDALLADPARIARMGAIGRERMGAPGGARAIAAHIAELLHAS